MKYLEQYERIKRSYNRFEKINKGMLHDKNSDYYQDEVYAFFINCYHLKDWLIKDLPTGIKKRDIESFVGKSKNLMISGALCTGSKHLIISDPRFDPSTKIGKRSVKVGLGTGPTTISVKYQINIDNKIHDAFTIATKCLKEWERFLKRNRLI